VVVERKEQEFGLAPGQVSPNCHGVKTYSFTVAILKTPRRYLNGSNCSWFPVVLPSHNPVLAFPPLSRPTMPDTKAIEKRARCETADQNEHDYDIYLFWPSLSNRDVSSDEAPSSPLYGVGLRFSSAMLTALTAQWCYPLPSPSRFILNPPTLATRV
jgi:hypothetical protein